jgi:hypothetical protein
MGENEGEKKKQVNIKKIKRIRSARAKKNSSERLNSSLVWASERFSGGVQPYLYVL